MLEKGAFVEEVEELPLNTTLLLPSDVLMTKFSLGIDWSILRRGKVYVVTRVFMISFTGINAFWSAFLLS